MIFVEVEGRTFEFDKGKMRVIDILKKLELLREEVLVFKDGNPVTEDEIVKNGEKITILKVVSRG